MPFRRIASFLVALSLTACAHRTALPSADAQHWTQAQQLVLVTSTDWDATGGELRRFDRSNGQWAVSYTHLDVYKRQALRTFPTRLRVFSSQGDADIDRFQESALFPGDAVVITQSSADGQWLFVVSQRYAAWVEASAIAEGGRDAVLGYAARAPFRIITGAKPRTVFTREQPRLSELQLDMGTRIPLAEAAANKPVNGQHPYTSCLLYTSRCV